MWRAIIVGLLLLEACGMSMAQRRPADEPLLDWSPWERYRATVVHPAAIIKPPDVPRARENIRRYDWARRYAASLESQAKARLPELTDAYLEQLIPATTPGDSLFTPCPACRDLGKPAHPHGQWDYSVSDPEHLICQICKTAFPNDKYPESIVHETRYGQPQQLTFYGGQPFNCFGYLLRPSFTANIRARKVGYMASICQTMAEAYLLTGNADYAEATRRMLLRFAAVYPNWLVHVGYGEYADLDPHVAALNIDNLPADEITSGAMKPDRKLYSGYWQGGRAYGTGQEAYFVRPVLEAYEFTCEAQRDGKSIYSAADRLKIERDLLLESTVLLVADKEVNNKSVANATAVSLVGMAMGHPGMVRFGLEVFMKTVDGWFLADGGTSESWSYAGMTLSGIWALGQAFRGYSDPPGYQDATGKRLENIDLYHDTNYKLAWQAMFNGLQGNLLYPPLADGHRTSALGAEFTELMADNYPDNPQYLALLKDVAGPDLARGSGHHALYFREPGLEQKATPSLAFPDYVFPVLQIGALRSGPTGRDSDLILSASDFGGHHHFDSLGLYYWQQGRELLSDLGYLWDHPMNRMTYRTFAHNTVMVDGQEQRGEGRGGKFALFASSGPLKAMEAESTAYQQASLYRRTVAQIEHAPGRQYVLDIFRVQGGGRHDYVFHGPNDQVTVDGPALTGASSLAEPVRGCVRLWVNSEGAEFALADVTIAGPDGRNLFPNPDTSALDAQTGKPVGFGYYQGDGAAEWGQAPGGHDGGPCVAFKVVKPGTQMVNVALLLGDSNGYSGAQALQLVPGVRYTVTFWVKGNGASVQGSALYWNGDPGSGDNRAYVGLGAASAFAPGPEWQKIEGEFTVPGTLDLEQVKQSSAAAPWKLTWQLADRFAFSALWPNESGFTSLLGEGWGQRDYQNTDLGAKLPYLVRRHAAGPQPTVYVGAFEGHAPGEATVKAVRRLAVPAAEAGNAVAVAVATAEGTDYFVSCLEARPLTLDVPGGPLEMNGRCGFVSVQNGQVVGAALVEGTVLRLAGRALAGG
jgi:hypothetical protein